MPAISNWVIKRLRVVRNPLIPNKNRTRLIAYAALEVGTLRDVIEEKSEEIVGFLLIVADDLPSVNRIDV
jgi:hypothetical protein